LSQVPIFINCRDRLTPLLPLLDYLERAGCERVHLLDNDSTYPPLLEYYERTPHTVIRLGENHSHKSFWESGLLDELGVRGPYVFTDPDLVPIEECPLDAIEYFAGVLERYPGYKKAGFGLKIDDLPDHFSLKDDVLAWESRFWHRLVAPRLYEAPIDTTFALYRGPEHAKLSAVRTGYPYLVRHTTWYLDSENLPEEHRYYIERARVTSWSRDGMAGGPEGPTADRARRMRRKLEKFAAEPTAPGAVEPRATEVELGDFAAALVQMVQPSSVIVTGTGEGLVTRRIIEHIGPGHRLLCFESSPEWHEALRELPLFDGAICALSEKDKPDDDDFAAATLSVLDSEVPYRLEEVGAWWHAAQPGAVVLINETGNGDALETSAAPVGARIRELGIPGLFLKNPRGAFLGFKPERP
jgi:hypothetical protein